MRTVRRLLARRRLFSTLQDAATACALLSLAIGLFFLLAPSDVFTTTPLYRNASEWISIRAWGWLFLLKGLVAAYALTRRWLDTAMVASIGVALYVFWALMSVVTAYRSHWTGTLGAILWTFILTMHLLLATATGRVNQAQPL